MGANVLRMEIFAKFELGASYQVFVLKSPHYAKPQNVIGHFKTDTVLTTNSEHYDRNKNAIQPYSTDSQTIG
jgi:hypothetical protein